MSFGALLHLEPADGERMRAAKPAPDRAEELAGAYRALGDPTRLALAFSLAGGRELCVCDLSWIAERPQNLVSHHMRVLKGGGIVRSRREGKMTMYSLTGKGRALLAALEAGDAP
jgi:ArsR family transcriptional regulator, lead/cadmium/zinc/bismuth-responsive transcriptional repressor